MTRNSCDWCYREMPWSELHKIKIPWYNIDIEKRKRDLVYNEEMKLCHECCEKLAQMALQLKCKD